MTVPGDETAGEATALLADEQFADGAVASPPLVTPAPGWAIVLVGTGAAIVLVGCFLVFWLGMGTAPRESAIEAFGVVFGALTVGSGIGAGVQAGRDRRRRSAPPMC